MIKYFITFACIFIFPCASIAQEKESEFLVYRPLSTMPMKGDTVILLNGDLCSSHGIDNEYDGFMQLSGLFERKNQCVKFAKIAESYNCEINGFIVDARKRNIYIYCTKD